MSAFLRSPLVFSLAVSLGAHAAFLFGVFGIHADTVFPEKNKQGDSLAISAFLVGDVGSRNRLETATHKLAAPTNPLPAPLPEKRIKPSASSPPPHFVAHTKSPLPPQLSSPKRTLANASPSENTEPSTPAANALTSTTLDSEKTEATANQGAPALSNHLGIKNGGGLEFQSASATETSTAILSEIERYRQSLGKATKRLKKYPKLARERGWEGASEFRIYFTADFAAPTIVLTRSGSHELLDSQARETLRQAIAITTFPESLKGEKFRLSFQIVFSLQSEG